MSIRAKYILISAYILSVSLNAPAQYLIDIAGSSVQSVRDPSRQASTEIDAVINNPAGTAFLPNGINLAVSNSYSGMELWDQGLELNGIKRNSSCTDYSGMFPSFQLAIKRNNWAFSISASSETGRWKLYNENGTNAVYNILQSDIKVNKTFSSLSEAVTLAEIYKRFALLSDNNSNPEFKRFRNDYSTVLAPSSMNAAYADISFRLGAARMLDFDNFRMSVYLGSKIINLSTDTRSIIGLYEYDHANAEFIKMDYYFKDLSTLSPENKFIEEIRNIAASSSDTELRSWENPSVNSSHIGFIPILGVHYQSDRLNAGLKYESDLFSINGYRPPMNFSLGVSCFISSNTIASIGLSMQNQRDNIFFDSRDNIVSGCISSSLTHNWRRILISGGLGLIHSPTIYNDGLRFCTTDSSSLPFGCIGLAYSITSRLRFDIAFRYLSPPNILYSPKNEIKDRLLS